MTTIPLKNGHSNTGIRKRFLLFNLSILVGTCMISCGGAKQKQWGSLSYSEKKTDGVLHINITDPAAGKVSVDLDTEASIYQKYSLSPISDDFLLLSSSDIGSRIINKTIRGEWGIFPVNEYHFNGNPLYIIFSGSITPPHKGNLCDRITIVYAPRNATAETLSVAGAFPIYGDPFEALDRESFLIRNGNENIQYRIQNGKLLSDRIPRGLQND